jgi:hypothetical protein
MPAIGPEVSRRVWLFASLAACLRADSEDEVWEVLGKMASALSAGNVTAFLDAIDRSMAGLEDLRVNLSALLGQGEVQSSIELISNEGDDLARTVEADWLLRITRRDETSGSRKRQQNVKCGFRKMGKKWKVVSLEPRSFFGVAEPK